ncbi:MAG: c-type cytochrome [Solimonas sp.]
MLVLGLALSACGGGEKQAAAPVPVAAPVVAAAPAPADPALQKTDDSSCKTCHGVAGTGAPPTGDTAAWQPRVAKGIDPLLDHTIDGFNAMPPMGTCPQCTEDQFVALIEYMSGAKFE